MIKRAATLCLTTALLAGLVACGASENPIAQRKKQMKAMGDAAKVVGPMLKGEAAYDGAKAVAAFTTMAQNAVGYAKLFPDNSKTGDDTTASPKIWEDKAGFEAANTKFEADLKVAMAEVGKSADAFKTAGGAVMKNCGSCHDTFRIKKPQ